MALEFAVRTLQALSADPVGTTYTISGLPFAPKAIIAISTNENTAVDSLGAGTYRVCVGFATSTTNRRAIAISGSDAAGTSANDQGRREDAVLFGVDSASAFLKVIDIDAFLSDGVRLIVDVTGSGNHAIVVILLGGDDILQVTTGDFTEPAAAGNFDVTTVGFEPSIVFFMGGRATVDGQTTWTHAQLSFGVGMNERGGKPGDQSGCWHVDGRAEDAVGTTNCAGAADSANVLQVLQPTSDVREYALEWIQSLANGFRLNQRAASAGGKFVDFLAIRGGGWKVGRGTTKTTATAFSLAQLGFIPKGLIVASVGEAEDAPAAVHAHLRMSFGAAESPTSRHAKAVFDRDAQATSQTSRGSEFDECYFRISDTDTIDALMDETAENADGSIDLVMDDVETAERFFGFVACGDTPPVPQHILQPALLMPLYRSG